MSTTGPGEAYRLYKRWCLSLGIQPADWITWLKTTQQIQPPADATKDQGVQVLRSAK